MTSDATDPTAEVPTDPAALAEWLIARRWHEATGPDAVDYATRVMGMLAWALEDPERAAMVFREAMHRVRYRDGSPTCPSCGSMPLVVFAGTQAFCPNGEGCELVAWNPTLPDGGPVTELRIKTGERITDMELRTPEQ